MNLLVFMLAVLLTLAIVLSPIIFMGIILAWAAIENNRDIKKNSKRGEG